MSPNTPPLSNLLAGKEFTLRYDNNGPVWNTKSSTKKLSIGGIGANHNGTRKPTGLLKPMKNWYFLPTCTAEAGPAPV